MSVNAPYASTSQMALSLLSAQAGPSGARAEVLDARAQGDASSKGNTGKTGRYDVNAIASAERGLERARLDDALEWFKHHENTSAEQRKSEATDRAVRRLNKRAENMSRALQKLGAGPLPEGQRVLSLFSSAGSQAVSISTTGQVNSVYLNGGDNQAVSIRAKSVDSVYTQGSHDAIAIKADSVESVVTDRSAGYAPGGYRNGEQYAHRVSATESNDAVAIQARRADSIYTGAGHDAVAVQADMISSIYAGSGNDSVAVRGGVISGVHGGEGNDAISVNAAIGRSVMRNVEFGARSGMGTDVEYVRSNSAEDRLRLATTNYSDVLGGAGNDAISVTVQEIISIDGGAGDDVISIGGGTVGLRVGAGSGNDVVRVAQGAELMIQIDDGDYQVETDGNDLVVRHSGGSVRIEDYQDAAAIGVAGFGAAHTRADPDRGGSLSDIKAFAEGAKKTDLIAPGVKSDLGYETHAASGGFQMIHLVKPNPMDIRA